MGLNRTACDPGRGACLECAARPFSVCASIPDEDLHRLQALAQTQAVPSGAPVVREGDPVAYVYNVTSGALRLSRLLPDGRRHVAGFLFAGDFIGLSEAVRHSYAVEAIEPSTVCRFRRDSFQALMQERRELEGALLARAGHELRAAQDQQMLLGRKTAAERLASFLLSLPAQDPMRPGAQDTVRLPMTRTDIADHLGMTLETVSRTMTRFRRDGLVRQLSLTQLHILRPEALKALAKAA